MHRLSITLICLISILAFAQEATIEEKDDTAPTEEKQKASSSKQADEFETPDTFEATEKLSEDVSAAFPVDI